MLGMQVLLYMLDPSCSAWRYCIIYQTHHARHAGIVVYIRPIMLSMEVLYYILDPSCSVWRYCNIYQTHHAQYSCILIYIRPIMLGMQVLQYARYTSPSKQLSIIYIRTVIPRMPVYQSCVLSLCFLLFPSYPEFRLEIRKFN